MRSGEFPHAHAGICWSTLLEEGDFAEATEACSFIGGRLPTVDEARSIIINCQKTEAGGECGVTNDCPDCDDKEHGWSCNGCSEESEPNTGIYSVFDDEVSRWTSTTLESCLYTTGRYCCV